MNDYSVELMSRSNELAHENVLYLCYEAQLEYI